MEARRYIFAGILSCVAMGAATATPLTPPTEPVRDTSCIVPLEVYVLPGGGTVLNLTTQSARSSRSNPILILGPSKQNGWASQRLLMRFDLQREESGAYTIDIGDLCVEGN